MFVAVDWTSKFTFVKLHELATRRIAADFLTQLIRDVPYCIDIVVTDNGTQFTTPGNRQSVATELRTLLQAGRLSRVHTFEWPALKK